MNPRFLSPLIVQELEDESNDGRGTWRVIAELMYYSAITGSVIRVPGGFKTDFASVPRLPFVFALAGDTAHEASVVHDYLYTVKSTTRRQADAVLLEASVVSGVPKWRARLMWLGVRIGGASHW